MPGNVILNNISFLRAMSGIQNESALLTLAFLSISISLINIIVFGILGAKYGSLYIKNSIGGQFLYLSCSSILAFAMNMYHILFPGSLIVNSTLSKFLILIYWFLIHSFFLKQVEEKSIFNNIKGVKINTFILSVLNFFLVIFCITLVVYTKTPARIISLKINRLILLVTLGTLIFLNIYFIMVTSFKRRYILVLLLGILSLVGLLIDSGYFFKFEKLGMFILSAILFYSGTVSLILYLYFRLRFSTKKVIIKKESREYTFYRHSSHNPIIQHQDQDYLK